MCVPHVTCRAVLSWLCRMSHAVVTVLWLVQVSAVATLAAVVLLAFATCWAPYLTSADTILQVGAAWVQWHVLMVPMRGK